MEPTPTTRSRTERSATVHQQIRPHLVRMDLESIKQIAETDKDCFPEDFITQCMKYSSFWQEAGLFLDAFAWFVGEVGPTSPEYFGLGKSKEGCRLHCRTVTH